MALETELTLLVLYAIVGFLLVLLGRRRRNRLAAAWPPPGRTFDVSDITGEEVALLVVGPQGRARAIEAAVARLRVAGLVTYYRDLNRLVAIGRDGDHELTPLSAAVLAAVADGVPVAGLARDRRVKPALEGLFATLRWRARNSGSRWEYNDLPKDYFRSAGMPTFVLGLAGLGAVFIPPHRWPVNVATVLVALAFMVVGAGVLGEEPSNAPTVGGRAAAELRARNSHLDPAMNPALTLYGPAAAALAVGLFGLAALAATDAGLAAVSFAAVAAAPAGPKDDPDYDAGPDSDLSCGSGDSSHSGHDTHGSYSGSDTYDTYDSGSGCGSSCGGCGGVSSCGG